MSFKAGDRVIYVGTDSPDRKGHFGTVKEAERPTNVNIEWDLPGSTQGVYPHNIRRVADWSGSVAINVPFQYQGTVKGTLDSGVQALPENLPRDYMRYNGEPLPGINWEKRAQNAEFDLAVVRGVSAARLEQIADAEKRIDDLKQHLEDEKGRTQLWRGVAARRYQKINDLLQEIKVLKNQAKDDEDYISLQARRLVKRLEQLNAIRKACDVDVGLDP